MYTVVLMAALTGGAETPDFRRNGCNGCHGGYVCSGFVSHGCHGCHGGYACHDCGGRRGLLGGLFGRRNRDCHGCHGWNYCCGPVYTGCHGGWGHCHGHVVVGPHCHGYPPPPPPPPPGGKKPMPDGKKKKGPAGDKETSEAPANIVVNLPANARLSVDGQPTQGTSSSRVLVTPVLPSGQDFEYTLRAEIERDGQTIAQTQTVTVRAGQQSLVNFNFATGGVASR